MLRIGDTKKQPLSKVLERVFGGQLAGTDQTFRSWLLEHY